jgi:DNA replication and repair protein RecF
MLSFSPTLDNLIINHVRNIKQAQMNDLSNINIILGQNGSGKTSVLEAINLLGLTRSFRTNTIKSVINIDQQDFTVFAKARIDPTDYHAPIGVTRNRSGERKIMVDGTQFKLASDLAKLLPIQVINSDTFKLLEGGPKERRQFLDWGVFHVEHQFSNLWGRLQRTIKQRNTLLRRGKIDYKEIAVWDRELAELAPIIDNFRLRYFERLNTVFLRIWNSFNSNLPISLTYHKGWDAIGDLQTQLARNFEKDVKLKQTGLGPHRCTLKLGHNNVPVDQCFSRGQLKMAVFALKIAQGQILKEDSGRQSIYLIDDLPSELDANNREICCRLLESISAQVFITAITFSGLESCWTKGSDIRMFHVEHGNISKFQENLPEKIGNE